VRYDIDSPEFKRYLAWKSDQILIEKLKEEIEQTKKFWYEHLEGVNKLHYLRVEQLKHALIIRGCYHDGFCDFCGWHEAHPHADDCEYVRLTGGAE